MRLEVSNKAEMITKHSYRKIRKHHRMDNDRWPNVSNYMGQSPTWDANSR